MNPFATASDAVEAAKKFETGLPEARKTDFFDAFSTAQGPIESIKAKAHTMGPVGWVVVGGVAYALYRVIGKPMKWAVYGYIAYAVYKAAKK